MTKREFSRKSSFKQTKPSIRKCPVKTPEIYSPYDVKGWITPQEKYKIPGGKKFESCYFTPNDEALKRAGVEVCARTMQTKDDGIHHRMVFRKGNKEGIVSCIHVVLGNLQEDGKLVPISSERKKELKEGIPVEDQYYMLKGYVEGIAQVGIQQMLIESFKDEIRTGQDPIFMNHLMRQQMTKALVFLVPEETKKLALFLFEYTVADNPGRMNSFSEDILQYSIDLFTKEEINDLNKIDGGIHQLNTKIRQKLARNPNLPEKLVRRLAEDRDDRIRYEILNRPDVPKDIIRNFAESSSSATRIIISRRRDLPVDIIKELYNDKDKDVRDTVRENFEYLHEDGRPFYYNSTFQPVTPKKVKTSLRVVEEEICSLINDEIKDLNKKQLIDLIEDDHTWWNISDDVLSYIDKDYDVLRKLLIEDRQRIYSPYLSESNIGGYSAELEDLKNMRKEDKKDFDTEKDWEVDVMHDALNGHLTCTGQNYAVRVLKEREMAEGEFEIE